MGSVLPVYVAAAGGGVIVDVDGNSLIDLASGIAVTSVGNSAPEVVRRVTDQVAAFTHTCFMVAPYEGYVEVCEALARLKAQEGLYLQDERGVTFLTPDIFRASISLPATAPPGNYEVDVTLFADTVILARTQTHFELVKTGFEEQVGVIARDWSLAYGLATAAIALFCGWLASAIFRRD